MQETGEQLITPHREELKELRHGATFRIELPVVYKVDRVELDGDSSRTGIGLG